VADWVTISSLATAGGTLVLAAATFSAVRSANRSARIAEQALREQRQPLLANARLEDPAQKIMFSDEHWIHTQGAQAVLDEENGIIYLGLPLRNVGSGIAVLQGWYLWPELAHTNLDHRPADEFRRQVRDIYVAPGDLSMWQGALRDEGDDLRTEMAAVRAERRAFTIDLLYTDQRGEHHTISRFSITPTGDERWLGLVGLHWNLDEAGPRPPRPSDGQS
jgi:hypothetical protein